MKKEIIKVYSFDIFDTILTRNTVHPTDIFERMQQTMLRKKYSIPKKLLNSFSTVRVKAENKVRLKKFFKELKEIQLKEIYCSIGKKFCLNQKTISRIMSLEERIEYDSVYPIAQTVNKIDFLRKQNKKIIFISDMYLPFNLIKKMLIKIKVYYNEPIYLSSEIGLKKNDGSLFYYVLRKEGCSSKELCHYGDDVHSDVCVPKKIGIEIDGWTSRQVNFYSQTRYFQKYKKYLNFFSHGNKY